MTERLSDSPDIQGEGNYKAARKYQKAQHEFAENGPVKRKAKEAAEALNTDEAGELEKARRESADKAKI
ncbi:MAG: hypothetical protein MRY59_09110 [Aquisalinus sp.]|nr:hypothetical protein [Aquisalinus sp.]